jgi:hypothetical protein
MIPAERLTPDRADDLFRLIREGHVYSALETLPQLAEKCPPFEKRSLEFLRSAINGREHDEVAGGVSGLLRWLSLAEKRGGTVPRVLVEQVISALSTRREIGLGNILHCTRLLFGRGALSSDDIARVQAALGDLWDEASYGFVAPGSKAAISLPYVRAECVRLSDALLQNGIESAEVRAWVDCAATDPLPDVRFASENVAE